MAALQTTWGSRSEYELDLADASLHSNLADIDAHVQVNNWSTPKFETPKFLKGEEFVQQAHFIFLEVYMMENTDYATRAAKTTGHYANKSAYAAGYYVNKSAYGAAYYANKSARATGTFFSNQWGKFNAWRRGTPKPTPATSGPSSAAGTGATHAAPPSSGGHTGATPSALQLEDDAGSADGSGAFWHSEVVICARSGMTAEQAEYFDGILKSRLFMCYKEIPEEKWEAMSNVKCEVLVFGAGESDEKCSGVESFEQTLSERRAGVTAADTSKAYKYLYGQGDGGAQETRTISCREKCGKKWAKTSYNVVSRNCNTYAQTVLSCGYQLCSHLPNLHLSNLGGAAGTCPC